MGFVGTPSYGGAAECQLILKVNSGVKILVTNTQTGIVKEFEEKNGVCLISDLDIGPWKIRAELREHSIEREVSIKYDSVCQVIAMYFNMAPLFTAKNVLVDIVDDDDNLIVDGEDTIGHWKLRFTAINGEYGTITFQDLRGQFIDIFLVGGGGDGYVLPGPNSPWGAPGGGGGYTRTLRNYKAKEGVEYKVVVGGRAGDTFFYTEDQNIEDKLFLSALHGEPGYTYEDTAAHITYLCGGNGGSGGGGGASRNSEGNAPAGKCGDGGTNGNNGTDGTDFVWYPDGTIHLNLSRGGEGQGSSTQEFEYSKGPAYAPGGAGGTYDEKYTGSMSTNTGENTGAGGRGLVYWMYHPEAAQKKDIMKGSSGIVVIRNSRGQYGFSEWV